MDEILDDEELYKLTSYRSKKMMVGWLERNRIPFLIRGDGKPLVNRHALAHVMGAPIKDEQRPVTLNFDQEGFKI